MVIPVLDAQVFDLTDTVAAGRYDFGPDSNFRRFYPWSTSPSLSSLPSVPSCAGSTTPRSASTPAAARPLWAICSRLPRAAPPHPYVLQKTVSAARRLTDGFCRQAVCLALEADLQLKRSADEPARILELFLVRLKQEAGRG